MLVMLSAELPVFVSVTDRWLVNPGAIGPKSKLSGTSCTVPFESVIAAVAVLVPSVTDVAVSVTDRLAGIFAGAVKLVAPPLAVVESDSDPQLGEQAVPPCVRVQATPLFFGSFPTVAANFCAIPKGSSALAGVIETVIAGTVIATEFDAA
jgi:hypothetical protein